MFDIYNHVMYDKITPDGMLKEGFCLCDHCMGMNKCFSNCRYTLLLEYDGGFENAFRNKVWCGSPAYRDLMITKYFPKENGINGKTRS